MSIPSWQPVMTALDRAADVGRTVDMWLRDDDAVAVTPALQRLADVCERHGMPVLLAVIPEGAAESLAGFVAAHPGFTPTQHGFAHTNHAAPGARACELGGRRPAQDVIDDLEQGRDKLGRMFGPGVTNILVPPWNRIDPSLLPALPDLGFRALSTFGPQAVEIPDLPSINCDLDLIDWRNGRICRPHAKLIETLAELIERTAETGGPLGLLTHHLAHDDMAWSFLEAGLAQMAAHPAIRFDTADVLLSRRAASAV